MTMDGDYFQHAVKDAVNFGSTPTTRVVLFATSGVIALYAFGAGFIPSVRGFVWQSLVGNDSVVLEDGML